MRFDKEQTKEVQQIVEIVMDKHRRVQNLIMAFTALFAALLVSVPLAVVFNNSITKTQEVNYRANCQRFSILANINEEVYREDQAQSDALFSGKSEKQHLAKTFGMSVEQLDKLTKASRAREERRLKVLKKLASVDCSPSKK